MSHLAIEYCVTCNYYPRAAGLADELEKKFGLRSELVKGRGGAFEVSFGGELLYSKKQNGRFPEPGEVAGKLQARLGLAAAPGSAGS